MVIKNGQIFNFMDTNGRRSDVLNALKIYLEILEELKINYPAEKWGKYPSSLLQFLFYKKALEKSKGTFETHKNYDRLIEELGADYQAFLDKDSLWINNHLANVAKNLDQGAEKRARHYTSTLVKLGLSTAERTITEAGYAYLNGLIVRDGLEELLPLDNINIVLLRQLAKLKIFSTSNEGKRQYYAPFNMALVLLLSEETVDKNTFDFIVQRLTPYSSDEIKDTICQGAISFAELKKQIDCIDIILPKELEGKKDIEYKDFKNIFKGSKNNDQISKIYYTFYCALKNFRENKNEKTYIDLQNSLNEKINKAFGGGKAVFATGSKNKRYSLEQFWDQNQNHPLLASDDYICAFYTAYIESKQIDGIKEYSDTTTRLLSATGLFQFQNLPELSYREILSMIFDIDQLREGIFGEITEDDYTSYEIIENCYLGKSTSLGSILNYSDEDISFITNTIEKFLGVGTTEEAKGILNARKSANFIAHINKKYPKEKIMELLPLFSNRKNDGRIKVEVNDAADVPTIYEYIIGIAWYYISNREFDLYNSLNLTLNADFEPVLHAGGGTGDIIIHYDEIAVMLEVTLMNKYAQKRGEWEPVLRHSLNLKAQNEPKETITFFIADELDYNTINIWRAVAAVSLESTQAHTKVNGVVIMPFTNKEILLFLKRNIYYQEIIKVVKNSFATVPKITDTAWQDKIMSDLIS